MRTGEVKEIELRGLSSAQNDYDCKDGEMQVCHNCVNDGTGLKPIQEATVMKTLGAGWTGLVFVHHTSNGDINIVVDGAENAWWYKDDEEPQEISEPATGLFTKGGYQITSTGNVMVVNFTEGGHKGLHYYRWKDGTYKYIGQAPPDIKLEFAAVHYSGTIGDDGNPKPNDGYAIQTHANNITIKFRADLQFSQGSMISYEAAFEDYPSWLDYIMGRVNTIKGEMRRQGLFMDKFFVRTAYRLYDGTYIMQSAPVMMAPEMEDNPMIWPYAITTKLVKDDSGDRYWEIGVKSRILYKPFVLCVKTLADAEDKERLKDWADVIDRICVFVTPQMQSYTEEPGHMVLTKKEKIPTYEQQGIEMVETADETAVDGEAIDDIIGSDTGEAWRKGAYRAYMADSGFYMGMTVSKRYSPPRFSNVGGSLGDNEYVMPEGNDAGDENSGNMVMDEQNFTLDAQGPSDLSAKLMHHQHLSVSYTFPDDEMIQDELTRGYYARMFAEFGGYNHIVQFEQKPEEEERQIEQQYLFYPLKEYSIDEAVRLGTADDTDNRSMEWPYMELNNSSKMWPRKGEVIQAPTDMSFVKFPKDTLENLTSRTDTLADDYNSWQNIMPGIMHTYNGRLNAANVSLTFKDMPETWLGGQHLSTGINKVKAQVVIETNGVTTKAVMTAVTYNVLVNTGYFYYPHPDAKRLEIMTVPGGPPYTSTIYKIELKTHPFMHGAYFYSADFDMSDYATTYDTEAEAEAALTKADGTLTYPNYMYTSEVDNPFFFPSQGVNVIGSGEIVAIKSATKAMSEGSAFGTMPLYAFCTDGIWPLSVGSTGLFVATNPPSRETLLNNDPEGALQIDNSIIFLSERGMMQLVGERTTLLSGDLQERFSTFDAKDLPKWQEIMTAFGSAGSTGNFGSFLEADDFMAFIKKGARMAFDYINYRIIVFRPYNEADKATHTSFIYDIGSKMWGTMDSTLTSSVEGYPQSQVNMVGAGGVTVIGQYGTDNATLVGDGKMMYTTRPMKLQKPDVMKTVRTLIERSVSHGGVKYLGLWGSRDMVNWTLIGAVHGGKMPRVSGTPYKYFIVGGWSKLNINGDAISRLTIEEKDKYTDKLR